MESEKQQKRCIDNRKTKPSHRCLSNLDSLRREDIPSPLNFQSLEIRLGILHQQPSHIPIHTTPGIRLLYCGGGDGRVYAAAALEADEEVVVVERVEGEEGVEGGVRSAGTTSSFTLFSSSSSTASSASPSTSAKTPPLPQPPLLPPLLSPAKPPPRLLLPVAQAGKGKT
ncbi:hypothetical protein BT69DRAFT_1356012 [Atractiella rhizophila]|nr:hypothetical protein BT69DRAFT_1356012 [Atractiella rhizophila]